MFDHVLFGSYEMCKYDDSLHGRPAGQSGPSRAGFVLHQQTLDRQQNYKFRYHSFFTRACVYMHICAMLRVGGRHGSLIMHQRTHAWACRSPQATRRPFQCFDQPKWRFWANAPAGSSSPACVQARMYVHVCINMPVYTCVHEYA